MKKIIALAAFVAIVVVIYTAGWFWAAGQASAYVKTLETADGITTPRLSCGSFGIGGFPFGFDATCTEASVVSGDITVTLPRLQAAAEIYNPTHVLIYAQSPVRFADAFTGSQSRLDFSSFRASARLSGWRVGRVSAILEDPVLNDTVLEDRLLARGDRFELHLLDLPEKHDATAGLAALAQYAKVENLSVPGFEVAAGEATFEGEISNLPDDVRSYGDADLLQRWQAAGGRFTVTGFTGVAGPDRFSATADLGLDSTGRLEGQVKLNSTGVVERLGPIVPDQFRGLILGAQAEDGSYSQTFSITSGVIFAGLVPAGMIPPLF